MSTKSQVDIRFLKKSGLPPQQAIHVASIMAGVSERAVRRQVRKAYRLYNQSSTLRRYVEVEEDGVEAA